MRRPGFLLLTLTLALAAVVATSAQDPQQHVFRTGVQTVPIYATVLDANNRLVPDLKQEHFEVFDNGKPAPITLFVAEVQPISVVVAIDTSGSMTLVIDDFVKQAAETFILRMLPADRAMIGNFDDRVVFSPEFTSNKDQLIRYIRTNIQYGNGTRLWDALDRSVAQLKTETSRKVVLALSDGEDSGSKTADGKDVLARAQDEHVMVYVIGMHNQLVINGQYSVTRPDRFLRRLTAETGGGNFEISKATELNSTFTRVADELHRQYVIGIAPAVLDGKLHKLEVKVKVPGMTARARQNYMATKQ
ncbi:MAG TPA: VWA domain-containing protein [Vicinamibacterales bacterium]|nr:VWA domain-containing protein [Vicinamibacterales bacterium]